jgi:hypothetical protein
VWGSSASGHKLATLTPQLAALTGTHIPVPGLPADATGSVPTIANFGTDVSVLFTKTRPKRISIVGSDGLRRAFLVKVSNVSCAHISGRNGLGGGEVLNMRHIPVVGQVK